MRIAFDCIWYEKFCYSTYRKAWILLSCLFWQRLFSAHLSFYCPCFTDDTISGIRMGWGAYCFDFHIPYRVAVEREVCMAGYRLCGCDAFCDDVDYESGLGDIPDMVMLYCHGEHWDTRRDYWGNAGFYLYQHKIIRYVIFDIGLSDLYRTRINRIKQIDDWVGVMLDYIRIYNYDKINMD